MAIKLGSTIINKKLLGVNSLNKIMLGVIEIFPNLGPQPPSGFDPSDFFTGLDEGVFYNFNQISSLFQTVLGMQPVTAGGQQIGVATDLSKPTLGPEMLANNDFDNGWVPQPNATIVGTELVVNQLTGATVIAQHPVSPTWILGATYEITFEISAYTSGTINATDVLAAATPVGVSGVGTHKQYYFCQRADFPNTRLNSGASGFVGTVANVSIKQVEGIAVTQATAAARPEFDTTGGIVGARFDTIDDVMTSATFSLAGEIRTMCLAVEWIAPQSGGAAFANHGFTAFTPGMGITGVNQNAYNIEGTSGGNRATSPPNYPPTNRASVIAINEPLVPYIEIQVNGDKTSNTNVQGGTFAQAVPFSIGRGQGFNDPANCRVVAVLLINRALTLTEQQQWNEWAYDLLDITP